ncbi:low temperature requirement protein A [Streptomyces sp. NPDC004822]
MTGSPPPPPASTAAPAHHRPLRRLTARSRDETHRGVSSLELFFDLCFIVAIAQAGTQLVHAMVEGHTGEGIRDYLMVFFAIWWAWMNFTWFASAYDNDDVLYRIATLIQMAGVLVVTAGVSEAFEEHAYLVVVLGYVIMRLAMTAQWLRVARSSRGPERTTSLRYAVGLCQFGWLGLLALPEAGRPWVFLTMALLEMAVPLYAERAHPTPWHPRHIAERYGLLTLIVLGETIAAATVAVKSGLDEHEALGELLPIAGGGLLIIFAAWWIYFAVPIHAHLRTNRQSFLWGYGHYLIFVSGAAIGAGLEVAVEQAVGTAHRSALSASAAVTLPTALFLLTVWALHSRFYKVGIAQQSVLPATALLVAVCTFLGHRAGLVTAPAAATGVTLTPLWARPERGRDEESVLSSPPREPGRYGVRPRPCRTPGASAQ